MRLLNLSGGLLPVLGFGRAWPRRVWEGKTFCLGGLRSWVHLRRRVEMMAPPTQNKPNKSDGIGPKPSFFTLGKARMMRRQNIIRNSVRRDFTSSGVFLVDRLMYGPCISKVASRV
jgi:hypothetical protein